MKKTNRTPATMFEYLADTSKTKFPGSKKPYKGLPDTQDRQDIIAFVIPKLFSSHLPNDNLLGVRFLETKKDKAKWFGIW